jgi:hypothetical protein
MKCKPLLVLLLCVLSLQLNAQNKIDRSKKELTEKEGVNYNKASGTSSETDDSGETGWFGRLLGDAFMYTIGGVFYYGLIGDYRHEDHLDNDLTSYPYHDAEAGNYYNPEFGENSVYVFRADVKDKFIYSNNRLFGNHLDVKVRPSHIFALEADYYQLYESQKAAGTSSNLSLFYFNFAYDRIRFNRFNLGWTVGASYIGSGVNRAGFSYGLKAEYFLKERISFLAGAKWSHIKTVNP